MTWVLLGGAVLIVAIYLYSLYVQGEIRKLVRALRWVVGGMLAVVASFVALRGNMMIGSMIGFAAAGVLTRGRLGPIDFGAGMSSPGNVSTVRSRYLSMRLDHETGTVSGTVGEGLFTGRDLASLSAEECWALYDEVDGDPDSLALFESWLDANRSGWREWFAEQFGMDTDGAADSEKMHSAASGVTAIEDAYEILGLTPDATADDIRKAHRTLMKKVHPDHGGSAFLAARINEAKDVLLDHIRKSAR
ncbi:J domain-containing protein [Pelagibacterium sediminicola]|uniref:J domain-containing protein n=1 Tax=Pelagibacterium sediminicola TaxID=2248761 RepID=UPI000E3217CF|nr:J domain-containing protein [Pelagibacterium sediminicola]